MWKAQNNEGDFVAESCDDSIVQVLQKSDVGPNDVAIITLTNSDSYMVSNVNGVLNIASVVDGFTSQHSIVGGSPIAELGKQFTFRGLITLNSASPDWRTGTVSDIEVRRNAAGQSHMIAANLQARTKSAMYASIGQVVAQI